MQYSRESMKYAIVKIKGRQYKVEEGSQILVDRLEEARVEHAVLLTVNDQRVAIGKPYLGDSKVKFKIVNQEEKGEKIFVVKYRAKSRYRKKKGFRPLYTRLLVENIS